MKNAYKDRLFDLLVELSKASVKFVICGGVACVLQGVERATYDLDIAVSFSDEDIKKLLNVTKKFKLIPRIPEPAEYLFDETKRKKWIDEKNALVYTFASPDGPLQIDIFLKYPISFDKLLSNSDTIKIEGVNMLVSSKDDLLYAKQKIKPLREKDKIDIKELKRLLREKRKNIT